MHNHGGATHLIIDVTGYYVPQYEAFVNFDGSVSTGTSRVITAQRTSNGRYTVTLDANVATCAAEITSEISPAYASGFTNGMTVTVTTGTLNSAGAAVFTDEPFNVFVSC